ncbi:MAG TPA: cytochrome c biogenesis protein CcdA [Candidatus Limnocylindrales bacterium]|nr:cytochrome c biogenesis protein CcdA [Candidatus Limnocylindrales bacterium]
MSSATEISFLVAVAAGLLSFLSPCVLPLVPAYLGQLTAIAVANAGPGSAPSRWTAVRHALAYVLGFGAVFTLLGVTATFAAAGLSAYIDELRTAGGIVLVVLGLSLAGVIRIPVLERTWRPLDAGASAALATAGGGVALAPAGGGGLGTRVGERLATPRAGMLASFGLGAIFAVGWTPCIGVILGGILGLAASSATVGSGAILLVGYTLGLGLPFLAVALLFDRSPAILRPLLRHGRAVSVIGGLLVVAIGIAMILDLLTWIVRLVPINTQI